MNYVNQYSEEFKLKVVYEVLRGEITKEPPHLAKRMIGNLYLNQHKIPPASAVGRELPFSTHLINA